jgi:Tfp pilus assembly protein PilV
MSIFPRNKRGISLVEVMIATFLVAVGILALLAMQPMSWKTAGRSNLLGAAAGILHQELTNNELDIMRLTSDETLPNDGPITTTAYASGEATPQTDDTAFTVETTRTDKGDGSCTVSITVTAPDNKFISESIIATRQQPFSP